ncbi:hypothetical protein CVT26_006504 [Gymnopilus dilepis]|uniref:Uncharacterized protein n=1 Tax=Gymnopilus dilepis TaxID=231916 RepID=A0A409W6J0_9AGAR|nr:hypothetical protein CVT26_006504 [Gymnopilus dilepis]
MLHVQRLTVASSRLTATEQLGMQNTSQSQPHVSTEAGQQPDVWDGAMLSSWEYVPNMGLTSKIGTDSDDVELGDDGDDDKHLAKRQKTFHGTASGSRPSYDSLNQVNSPGSNEGIAALQNALNASFAHAAATTASPSPEKTASDARVEAATERLASPRSLTPASQAPRIIEQHPLFRTAGRSSRYSNRPVLPLPGLPVASTSNPSSLPSGASNSRRQPHRYAKAIYTEVDESPPPYAANQDEIEAWADATVASIVYGKRPLPVKMDEIDVRKMNGRKLVETLEKLSVESQHGTTTASTSSGSSGSQNAALPRISMSSRSKAISKALFGVEDPNRPPVTSKPTFKRKRWAADISRASSSSNVQTSAFPSSFSTPSLDYHPLSAIRPEAEGPPLSPASSYLEQSPIAEPPGDSPAHSESIVADMVASDSLLGTPAVEEKEELSDPDAIPLQFTLRSDFQNLFMAESNSGPSESNQPLAPRATSTTTPSFVDGTNHAAASSSNISRPLPSDPENAQLEDDPLLNSGQPEDITEIISPEAQVNVDSSPVVAHGFVPPHSGHAMEIWNPPSDLQYGLPDRDLGSSPPETKSGHSDPQTVPGFQLPGLFTPTSQAASLSPNNSPRSPIPKTKPSIDESGSKLGTEYLAFEPSGPYMYELSEEASRSVSIPTVFEPEYLKNRFRDRWRNTEQMAELGILLTTQSVIAEAAIPFEVFYDEEEPPLSGWVSLGSVGSDEEEIDELADDSDQDTVITTASAARGRKRRTRKAQGSRQSGHTGHGPAEAAGQSLTSYFELRNFDVLEEGATEQDMLVDPPIDLVIPVARWTRELQCLVKGKQKLMEKDLLYLRDVLKDVHRHRAHIRSSSSLAKAVLDVANMKQEDIPNLDKAGLRSLARQCIFAWEVHKYGEATQGASMEHSDAS